MTEPHNPHLRRAILEVVNNQLRDGTPPETRATLDRLLAQGTARKDALDFIGCVVSSEIFDIVKSKEPFNEARYIAMLRALPRLPWEEEQA